MPLTPGPWYWENDRLYTRASAETEEEPMGNVVLFATCTCRIRGCDNEDADKALVRAAPELLEALEDAQAKLAWILRDHAKDLGNLFAGVQSTERRARIALARAEPAPLCGCPDPDCPGKWPGTPQEEWRCGGKEGGNHG